MSDEMISTPAAGPVDWPPATDAYTSPGSLLNSQYAAAMTHFHDLEMTSITGEQVSFDQYKGNLALVVNVASA